MPAPFALVPAPPALTAVPERKLRYLRRIDLGADSSPQGPVREVAEFDFDGKGHPGFVRREEDGGSSFILVVSYEDGGPRADAVLTYSQSTDTRSPHFADQTARYATPDPWRKVMFTTADIAADPALRVQEIAAP